MTTTDLRRATVEWLSAVLDSAHVDTIGVSNWWDRATAALQTAATASSYGEAVSTAARKLQIDVYRDTSAATLARLETVIGADLPAWSEIVHAEAPYLVALVRIHRQARKEKTT